MDVHEKAGSFSILSTSHKKVVTVDDDPSIRFLIKSALQALSDVEILEAGDGVSGLEIIREKEPDLILLDVVMPKMDGIAVLQALRTEPQFALTPVILLTAVKDNSKISPLLEPQKTEYLAKPFLLEALREKVREILFPQTQHPD